MAFSVLFVPNRRYRYAIGLVEEFRCPANNITKAQKKRKRKKELYQDLCAERVV